MDEEARRLLDTVHHKKAQNWVVYLQHKGNGETAVRYLARYVHRSALSDKRLKGKSRGLLHYFRVIASGNQGRAD